MTTIAHTGIENEVFGAAAYDLPVPAVDGYKAQKITIRFVGVVDLDRTDMHQLAFVEALRLGVPVRVIVTGRVSGKGFTHSISHDEEKVAYYASLRVDDVELGEPA
jgi:hypothetical protein